MLLGELELSYMRRTHWEARVLAIEIAKAVGELLGSTQGQRTRGYRRVPANTLLATMGARIT